MWTLIKVLFLYFTQKELILALDALQKELKRVTDPKSPGGRKVAPEERPGLNRAFWEAYDKAVSR